MDLGFFACYYFFIDSTVTYIKKGKEEKFHKGQRQAGPWGHPSTSKILWAANCFKYHSWKWCRDGESVHCVCAGSYYLNQYQCFKNWQEHEDLEASLVARKPKWNIKYLKSRSDLINAFSSNPAFKLSHSIGEMDLKMMCQQQCQSLLVLLLCQNSIYTEIA